MKKTEKGTKKFTKKEKNGIIKESKRKGVKVTLAKYAFYSGTFYYWKKKYDLIGEVGIDHGMTKERLAWIRKLERGNEMLKRNLPTNCILSTPLSSGNFVKKKEMDKTKDYRNTHI